MGKRVLAGVDATQGALRRSDLDHKLGSSLAGAALLQGDPGYVEACTVWNAMIERRPSLVVRCSDSSDVARVMRFARQRGLVVTARGGGHNIGGRAIADGGVMIDLSQRRRITVLREERVADVEPGALLQDVDRATLEYSLVLPSGIISETGIAGLTLGGGFGWLSRRFGLTCDHLVEAEVVTGAGETIVARDAEHPDLLWALRGGGGAGGVVTRFRFRLRPFRPSVVAGLVVRGSEHLREAAERFRGCAARAPEGMGSMLKLCAGPPAPFLPKELHGAPVAITIVCHGGDAENAAQDMADLRGGPGIAADLVKPRPFLELQTMFDAGEPKGRRDYWKSEYVSELDDGTLRVLLDATARLPSPQANIKVFHLGGAVARVSGEQSAAAHRDARFIIVVASAWEDPAQDASNIAWVRETWALVHRRSGRGGYVNFLTEDADTDEQARAQAGVDRERLAAVRLRYDPDGLLTRATQI